MSPLCLIDFDQIDRKRNGEAQIESKGFITFQNVLNVRRSFEQRCGSSEKTISFA